VRVAITLALLLVALSLKAATNTAATASRADVVTAYNLCNNGDTLNIPAGDVTWATGITVSKNIYIYGAGTNATIIHTAGFDIRLSSDLPFRLSNMTFSNANWAVSYIVNISGSCKQFRLDHCLFYRAFHTVNIGFNSRSANGCFGVIDHCVFVNCNEAIFNCQLATGDGAKDGNVSWSWGVTGAYAPGTTNSVYIESNFFWNDGEMTSAQNNNNQQFYSQNGGRGVFRYNRSQNTSGEPTYIDTHPGTSGYRSQPLLEIYSNNCSMSGAGQFIDMRGGQNLVWGNSWTNSAGTYFTFWNEFSIDIMTNSYFWSNYAGGVKISTYANNGTYPYQTGTDKEGIYYFTNAPQSGQVFFPYTPLTYPHPMVTAQDGGGGGGGTDPITSVSISSVDTTASPGYSTNITVSVQNVGGGTLTGYVTLSITNPWVITGTLSYSLVTNASTNFTLTFYSTNVYAASTMTLTDNGGGAVVPLLGGYPKLYVHCLGDSLTGGGSSTTTNVWPGGYRLPLYTLFTNAGINVVFLGSINENPTNALPYKLHDGHGGYETGDLEKDYWTYLAQQHAPDWVLLQAGLNDFRHNNSTSTAWQRLSNLVTCVHTNFSNARIILASMNPWTGLAATNNTMDALYNPKIPLVASNHYSGKVLYVNMLTNASLGILHSDVMADETHFQASGYNKMATNFFNTYVAAVSGNHITVTSARFTTAHFQ